MIKKISSEDLSILIFKDRIAFCTLDQTLYFELEKKNNADELVSWIKYNNLIKKNNKSILFDSKGVVVPNKLFDVSKKNLYLSLTDDELEDKIVETNIIEPDNQVFVFSKGKNIDKIFSNSIKDLETKHFASYLLPFLSKVSRRDLKKNVFIHLRENYFDLFIYQGSLLLLFNSYPHDNEQDFLYYLFFVLEQFYLKPNQFQAYFLGKFEKYKKYYIAFEKFHIQTNFTQPKNPEIESNHPAPFFNYFFDHENNSGEI